MIKSDDKGRLKTFAIWLVRPRSYKFIVNGFRFILYSVILLSFMGLIERYESNDFLITGLISLVTIYISIEVWGITNQSFATISARMGSVAFTLIISYFLDKYMNAGGILFGVIFLFWTALYFRYGWGPPRD